MSKILEQARKKVSFDLQDLSKIIYGGQQQLEFFLDMQAKISSDPILKFDPSEIQLSRKQLMDVSAKRLLRYHELFEYTPLMKGRETLFFSEQLPLSVHFSMFVLTLRNLCSDKQVKLFLEPTFRGQIFGCYAQTQLGHGSDLQSLETTATYNKQTDSFILNTPTASACKWWIGELGVFANHACVMAQLIIDNKNYGVHAFIAPIRNRDTHIPLPGIEVGDIGPKYGYNSKDNGYLKFNNYVIPRDNMLNKYTKVSREGVYERRGNEKVTYATMLIIRAGIPRGCYYALSQAITILTRYSLIRTQFKDVQNKQIPIFDYQLQQDKILPHIAETYANLFGYQTTFSHTMEVISQVRQRNDFSRLNSTHSLASGLKSIFTADCLKALEEMRRALGGHGFSSYSGLPGLQQEISPTATYQGQNSILLLQTARFLLKSLVSVNKGKQVPDIVEYLKQVSKYPSLRVEVLSHRDLLCPETLRKIFMNHSYYKIQLATNQLRDGVIEHGLSPKKSWDSHSGIALAAAGSAFTYYWIFENFMKKVFSIQSQNLRAVMLRLLALYGVHKILQNQSSFYVSEVLDSSALKQLLVAKQLLLKQLKPEAIGLVQAFQYDDNTLRTAIGGRDGKPYQTILDWARNKNPANNAQNRGQFVKLMDQVRRSPRL